jgi:subtilase family serine protease
MPNWAAKSSDLIPNTGAVRSLSDDETESDLDLEYTSAMAPGATVSLYSVGDSQFNNAFDSTVCVIDNAWL